MATTAQAEPTDRKEQSAGCYVYGIMPADIELTGDADGVGDPPGELRIVRSDDLAALVSDVDLTKPLGSPEDLQAHKQILDDTAADVPVLPLRFGAVLESEEAVTEELLKPHHDEFAAALDELDGRVQLVVRGRYEEDVILNEILTENPEAARMAEEIRGSDPDATRDVRIRLGEMISEAISAKRAEDIAELDDAMADMFVASVVRDPTHERDAVHVAFLVEADREDEFVQAVEELAKEWDGRIALRVLGPMAAYDFVGTQEPAG
jgi:hypothetical protein